MKEAGDLNFYEKLMEKGEGEEYTGYWGEREEETTGREYEAREKSAEPHGVDGRATGGGI